MSLLRHPLSASWPDMAREDFDALVLSIGEHGLREPITLLDGQVLDGWHRYQACESLGIEGATVEFVGTIEEADALVSDRHTRRNITPGQRAVAVLAMFNWRIGAGRPKESPHVRELTTGRIAEKAGVSVATIERAKEAIKADPQAIEKIRKGEATATSIIKEHKPAKQEPAAKAETIDSTQLRDEYNELVDRAQEMADQLETVQDVLTGDPAKQLLALRSQLNSVKASRDAAIRERGEMLKDLTAAKTKIARLERELAKAKAVAEAEY